MTFNRSASALIFGIAGIASLAPLSLSAAGPDAEISRRIVEIGLRVERLIEVTQYNQEHHTLDKPLLKRQAEAATRELEGIERELASLPDQKNEPLAQKLERVKKLARNLSLAAKLDSSLPKRVEEGSPVRHLDRHRKSRAVPANDDCEGAFTLDFGSYSGDTTDATNDGEGSCGSSLYSPDVWYRFVPTGSGRVVIDTIGSAFDTVLSVHRACPGTLANEIECNDDTVGLQSAVSFLAYSGAEYFIRVSGVNGAAGTYVLTLSEGASIGGTVTVSETGEPLGSIQVEAYDSHGYSTQSGFSNIEGDYQIDGLLPGQYFLVTDNSWGFLNELYDNLPFNLYVTSITDGDPVVVDIGLVTTGIDFALDLGGAIEGMVQSETTGEPIEGVRVYLYTSSGSILWQHADTDESGRYSLERLAEGSYYVFAWSPEYRDELFDDLPCQGGAGTGCSLEDGVAVEVTNNQTVTDIDFSLVRMASIEGIITDRRTGQPIGSAQITVYDNLLSEVGTTQSDDDGAFVVGGLSAGTYFAAASREADFAAQLFDGIDCPANGCPVSTGTPVAVPDLAVVSGVDFDLIAKGSIEGNVLDTATSMPIPGIQIRAFDHRGILAALTSSDQDGNFVFQSLDAGEHFLVTNDPEYFNEVYDNIPCPAGCDPTVGTPVPVLNGLTLSGINFSLVPKGMITGTVVAENGAGPIYSTIRIFDNFGSYHGKVWSNSTDGTYRVTGLDDGSYFVIATAYCCLGELYDGIDCWEDSPWGCPPIDGTPVTVTHETVTSGIDFSLKRNGRIFGTVTDSTDGSFPSGRVYATDTAGSPVENDYFYSDAGYSILLPVPGDYLIIADTYDHVDQIWEGIPCSGEYPEDCDLSEAVPITVEPETEININFSLDRLGKVSGSVHSSATGLPLEGSFVRLFDSTGQNIATGAADASGHYEIFRVWPGSAYIATDVPSTYINELFDNISCPQGIPDGCDPLTGSPVIVAANSTVQEINFNLDTGGGISGQIFEDTYGRPLGGIPVELWDSDGIHRKTDSSDSQGRYSFSGLESGTFFIATDQSSPFVPLNILYDAIPCLYGPPESCDPTKGTPIPVSIGTATRFIDIVLPSRDQDLITGRVSEAGTGNPIPNIIVDVWNAGAGGYVQGAVTDLTGTYILDVEPGNYLAATDNTGHWINQIFQGIECLAGSPYNGDCDPLIGTVFAVQTDQTTSGIDFSLNPISRFFADGFESGGTGAWSATTP